MKTDKTEMLLVQIKDLANLEGTTPSFSVDATWSTDLNNFLLYGMLIHGGGGGGGMSPTPPILQTK